MVRTLPVWGAVIVLVSIVFMLVPFRAGAYRITSAQTSDPSVPIGSGLVGLKRTTVSCNPAFIDAWHARSSDGLFSFVSGSLSPPLIVNTRCRHDAQRRVAFGLIGVLAGVALILSPRFGRRPEPPDG
jgi:hypothetical protein